MPGMIRPLVVAALCLSGSAAVFAASCDANVSQGCLAGPCVLGAGGAGGSGSSSSGAGTGGTADTCPIAIPYVPRTGDIPCNVFAVIHPNCNPCHANPMLGGAPFPLLNYTDTQKPYSSNAEMQPTKLRYQQMFDQTRPGACPRMPLGGSLSAEDYATLTTWLVDCAQPAPSGEGCGCPEDAGTSPCICEGGTCP